MDRNKAAGGNFDWVAPIYDALAFVIFGRRLQRAQTIFLDRGITPGASVLLVGGGTGWLLEQLLTHHRPGRIVYLESSARMVAKATRRMTRKSLSGSVEFRVGDERSIHPDERYDVVITPFLLDLFTDQSLVQIIIPTLKQALQPGGFWLVTDFVNTPAWWQKRLLSVMILFFRITAGIEARQLANWRHLLSQAGLTELDTQPQVGGMVLAVVYRKELNPRVPQAN